MADKKNDQNNKVAFDASIQTLITEYNGIRQASLSRDDAISKLDNFVMVILAAVLASYPTLILDKQYYLTLPIISIFITAFTFTRRLHKAILDKLALYEQSLSKRVSELLRASAGLDITTVAFEDVDQLWSWQRFYEETDTFGNDNGSGKKETKLSRLKGTIVKGGIEIALVFSSIGFLVLYIFYNSKMCWTEWTVFIAASLYSALLIAEYGRDWFDRLGWLNTNSGKSPHQETPAPS